jgi:hypothetical protein
MAKRTGDIELAGVLTTPAGASSGLAGEDLSLTAGAGNTTGVGGNVILTSGAGGATSGVAGDIALTVGAVVSGDGGNITLSGGAGDAGGDITLTAGAGSVAAGGDVSITSGDSAGTIDGAQVSITSGAGGSTGVGGAGGPVTITAGAGAGTAGDGGNITLVAGAGSGTGSDGAVVIPDSTAPTAPANKLYSVGGVLSWNGTTLDTGGGGISAVVEDTTPQLGGALDGQGFAITDATYPATINAQVGVTYTAVLADADKIITLTNAAAIAMTIPANASVAYPIGTKLNFQQLGAGAVTVGITTDTLLINSGATLVMNGQNSIATALKITATEWVLFGQLVPAIAPLTSVAISDLDDGTDGELITWDAAGVATTVPAGTATQVLTSNGAGAEPTFQTVGVAGSAANLATTGADVNVDLAAPPTIGQTLVATSATTSTWQTPAGGGIANVVEDTTPQLGGNLDVQTFSLITPYHPSPESIDLLPGNHVPGYAGEGGSVNLTAGDGHYLSGSGAGQINITDGADSGDATFSGHVNITGGTNSDYRGQGYGTGGDINLVGGIASGSSHAGDVFVQGGNAAGAGDGGDITLQSGTTSSGSTGAIVIPTQAAPTVTTNKLYNVAGALTWNGTDLTAGGISNVVEDTTPQLGGALDVNDFAIIGKPPATVTSVGGALAIGATDGGATSGDGGATTITSGSSTDGDAGDITISAGDSALNGGGGSIITRIGYGDGGKSIQPGDHIIQWGDGVGTEIAAITTTINGEPYDGMITSIGSTLSYVLRTSGDSAQLSMQTGQGTGTAGQGGDFLVLCGGSGTTGIAGSLGGAVKLTGGNSSDTVGSVGGNIELQAGRGISANGEGGHVIISSGGPSTTLETSRGNYYLRSALTSDPGYPTETKVTRLLEGASGAATTAFTYTVDDDDAVVYTLSAIARDGTDSAAFRIFGAADNIAGTTTLTGSNTVDRTDSGGNAVDWDISFSITGGTDVLIEVDSGGESVDWKLVLTATPIFGEVN